MVLLFFISLLFGQIGTHQIFGEVNWETPSGTIDGVNAVFTVDAGSVTFTFVAGRLPQTNDWLRAFYWKDGASAADKDTLTVYRNGILQLTGTDYTFVTTQAGFISGIFPVGL